MSIRLEPCRPVATTPVGQRILDAAGRLFYEDGITATGVDRIVEEAGTTKRTLYQRFRSKDALAAAYLQHRAHRWQTALLDTLTGSDPADHLDVIYDQAVHWTAEGPRGCAFINAWSEVGGSDHEALAVIRAEKAWMLDLFTQVAGGQDQTGALLHILYEGAQVTAAMQADSHGFETARSASHHILAGNL